jgi:hypothetical protein
MNVYLTYTLALPLGTPVGSSRLPFAALVSGLSERELPTTHVLIPELNLPFNLSASRRWRQI